MKEIIVTGSTGFVGKNLCPYLENLGYKVTKLSLRDPEWKIKISKDAYAIIHLAGLVHDLKNASDPQAYYTVNRDLTQEIYDLYKALGIEKFIYFSSVKAVADSLEENVLTEEYPPNPKTPYGISKRQAEEYILENLVKIGNKRSYILRPAMIHGPNNKGNLNVLYKLIEKGIPYPFASFQNQRSFLSIDNLNFIVKELCKKEIESGIYNVCDNSYLSTLELIQLINEGIGKKTKALRLNKKFISFVAKIGDTIHLPFNTEKLTKLTENYMVSNAKIVSAMGIGLPVSAREGMLKTIRSFKVPENK